MLQIAAILVTFRVILGDFPAHRPLAACMPSSYIAANTMTTARRVFVSLLVDKSSMGLAGKIEIGTMGVLPAKFC